MRGLVETAESISAQIAGKALPADQEAGVIELEIERIGTQEVEIVSTPGNLGGRLRWFLCPGCGIRVRKLYLPINDSVFLCRRCHRLEYRQQALREFRKASGGREESAGFMEKQRDVQDKWDWLNKMLMASRERTLTFNRPLLTIKEHSGP